MVTRVTRTGQPISQFYPSSIVTCVLNQGRCVPNFIKIGYCFRELSCGRSDRQTDKGNPISPNERVKTGPGPQKTLKTVVDELDGHLSMIFYIFIYYIIIIINYSYIANRLRIFIKSKINCALT